MIKTALPELQTELENLRRFSLDVYQAIEDRPNWSAQRDHS